MGSGQPRARLYFIFSSFAAWPNMRGPNTAEPYRPQLDDWPRSDLENLHKLQCFMEDSQSAEIMRFLADTCDVLEGSNAGPHEDSPAITLLTVRSRHCATCGFAKTFCYASNYIANSPYRARGEKNRHVFPRSQSRRHY